MGSLPARDCAISYRLKGRELARAVVGRDLEGLRAELTFEQQIAASIVLPGAAGRQPEQVR